MYLTVHSWTAVVQGAVIYGIEKIRHKEARYMSAITKSFGIVLQDRFEWLIRKGDLVISNEKRSIQSRRFWIPPKDCINKKWDLPIYYYLATDGDDDVPQWWEDGQKGKLRLG